MFCRMYVRVSALSRWQILTNFDEIWHRRLEPETTERFRCGEIHVRTCFFYPIIPPKLTRIFNGKVETLLRRLVWTDYSGS